MNMAGLATSNSCCHRPLASTQRVDRVSDNTLWQHTFRSCNTGRRRRANGDKFTPGKMSCVHTPLACPALPRIHEAAETMEGPQRHAGKQTHAGHAMEVPRPHAARSREPLELRPRRHRQSGHAAVCVCFCLPACVMKC